MVSIRTFYSFLFFFRAFSHELRMTMHDHKMKHKALQVLRCVVLVTTTTSPIHHAQSAGGGDAAAAVQFNCDRICLFVCWDYWTCNNAGHTTATALQPTLGENVLERICRCRLGTPPRIRRRGHCLILFPSFFLVRFPSLFLSFIAPKIRIDEYGKQVALRIMQQSSACLRDAHCSPLKLLSSLFTIMNDIF